MNPLLLSLLIDLQSRCISLILQIKNSSSLEYLELTEYIEQTLKQLDDCNNAISDLVSDPALLNEHLIHNHYNIYAVLATRLDTLETRPVVAIVRYQSTDHFLYNILNRAVVEIKYPLKCPLVLATSNKHYWAYIKHNIIGVTIGEASGMLAWVDLFHELAHILYAEIKIFLQDEFIPQVQRYFNEEMSRFQREGKWQTYQTILITLQSLWQGDWLMEMTSDMVATYLVGASYGWGHIRLCTRFNNPPFKPNVQDIEYVNSVMTHPADTARMIGINKMLTLLDYESDAINLSEQWDWYLSLRLDKKPDDFNICYPIALIEELAFNIISFCKSKGLVSIKESNQESIPSLLNQAWTEFIQNPRTYRKWEQEKLNLLAP